MPRESRSPRGLPPVRKSLGQHFLEDRRILERIVDALDPNESDTVIEIGPGRGSLTEALVPRVGRLVLVEYDRALAARLRERYARTPSVSIVEADVLEVSLASLAEGPFKLIGNVPYYITTPILFHALEAPRATRIVLLVQREVVGERSGRGGRENRVPRRARLVHAAAQGRERGRGDRATAGSRRERVGRRLVSALRAERIWNAPQADAARRASDCVPRRGDRRPRSRARVDRAVGAARDAVTRGFCQASPGALQSRFVSAKLNPSSSIAMFTVLIATSAGA
jgi:hypothetical protein